MIFQETWKLLVEHRKTQTRRLIKGRIGSAGHADGTEITYWELGSYKLGQRLHVMPARGVLGIKKVADIEITRLRREDAREISEADALAEGFNNGAMFLETWCKINDPDVLATWRTGLTWTQATVGVFMQALRERPAKFYDCLVIDFKILNLYPEAIAHAQAWQWVQANIPPATVVEESA
jgi:hypothetical protein